MKNKILFQKFSFKMLIILLISFYSINIYPQNCEYQTDTLMTCFFSVGYKGKYEPKQGNGYIKDIKDVKNLDFSSDTAFMNSFCKIIVLGEEYSISFNHIINDYFKDSTDNYKRKLYAEMVEKFQIMNEKEYDINLKFKDFDVILSFSKFIADINVITYYKSKYIRITNQTYDFCKKEGVDKIYRIIKIREVLSLSEDEKSVIDSLLDN